MGSMCLLWLFGGGDLGFEYLVFVGLVSYGLVNVLYGNLLLFLFWFYYLYN